MSDDVLRRELFALPAGLVYLDGNSLGALPRAVEDRLRTVVADEWGTGLIGSWNRPPSAGPGEGWIDLPARVARRLAPLLGAEADEVHVGESTSQALFATMVAASRMRPGRSVVVLDRTTFPTDAYVAQSVCRMLGLTLRWCEGPGDSPDGGVAAVQAVLDDDVALVSLTHVDFRTGALWAMPEVTRAIQEAGALAQWDLCHSTGALEVDLAGSGADLAVGCTYKYLNAGPGSPAYTWVARRHHEALDPPVAGWMGHTEPFAMRLDHTPRPGVGRLAVGTPPVLALSALDAALTVFEGVDMAAVRRSSVALTERFVAGVDDLARRHPDEPLSLASPRDPERRGSQVSLRHPQAYGLVQALVARGVVGDFRDPDIARFGFAPLYVSPADVDTALEALAAVLAGREHHDPAYAERQAVT